jgi:probable F420-dependent oxidoreductase
MAVVVEADEHRARAAARKHLESYLVLPNYGNNWLRAGYTESDLFEGGSDRLVDDLVAWGKPGKVADRVRAFYDAGADHVCLQVLSDAPLPRADWAALAKQLTG